MYTLLYTFIHFYTLVYTFIHFCIPRNYIRRSADACGQIFFEGRADSTYGAVSLLPQQEIADLTR